MSHPAVILEVSDPSCLERSPLVSVTMSAYNHAPWIAQAIEGVVTQRCSFPFELIIGEDGSTDDTAAICRDYQRRHPRIIRLVTADANTGSKANLKRQYERIRGRYHALCEGDDWWCDPLKLQAQVEFLETHPDCSLCFTRTRIVSQTANGPVDAGSIGPRVPRPIHPPRSFLREYAAHTSSLLFRSLDAYPAWFWDRRCLGDIAIHLLCMERGPAGFLDRTASVYRITGQGLWSGKGGVERSRAIRDACRLLRDYSHEKRLGFRRLMDFRCLLAEINLGRILLKTGQRKEARREWREILASGRLHLHPGLWWRFVKLAARAR